MYIFETKFLIWISNESNVIRFKGGGDVVVRDKEKLRNAPGENSMPLELFQKIPHPGTKFWRAGSHPAYSIL